MNAKVAVFTITMVLSGLLVQLLIELLVFSGLVAMLTRMQWTQEIWEKDRSYFDVSVEYRERQDIMKGGM